MVPQRLKTRSVAAQKLLAPVGFLVMAATLIYFYHQSELHLFLPVDENQNGSQRTLVQRRPQARTDGLSEKFSFVIKVLAYDRLESVSRCLESLARADYVKDRVKLHVFIDHFQIEEQGSSAGTVDIDSKLNNAHQILKYVDKFDWKHGEKVIHYRTQNAGLQAQWLEAWWPSSEDEFAFIVEDDMVLSPLFYRYLRALIANYYYNPANSNPSIYGVSLQRPRFVGGNKFASSTPGLGCHIFPTKFISATTAWLSRLRKFKVCASGSRQYLPPLFSVAPMMDWTDNHYRTLARLISHHAWLYTEMVVAETIVHQQHNLDKFLEIPEMQHPVVLQIGGSNLSNLAKAAELANAYGYDEINLNCGCPSERVAGHGCFGAQLMLNPKLVGEAMASISANSDVPVSVKCRIGVDDHDTYDKLCSFIDTVASLSPTKHFIVHARKALLKGLSPAENRTVPPLKYEYVFSLIRDFPHLDFTINGGITTVHQVNSALQKGVYGVMMGRAAYNTPWATLGHVDTAVYGVPSPEISRRKILQQYQKYAESVIGKYGTNKPSIRNVVKPLLHLFHSEPGAGVWKRRMDAAFRHCTSVQSLLEETLEVIPDYVLDASPPSPISDDEPFAGIEMLLPQLQVISSCGAVVEDSCRKVTQNI